jgi:YD repeat-containing protein
MQGDLASITNAAGQTTTYTHYDKHGRVLRSTDAYGLRTEHTYHARGWLLSTTVTAPANSQESAQASTSSFEYDATGQLTKASTPEGGSITYSYDAAHRLIGITDTFGNSITYTLDAMGNRLQEHTKDPNAVLAQQVSRVLDALNRVQQTVGGAQ